MIEFNELAIQVALYCRCMCKDRSKKIHGMTSESPYWDNDEFEVVTEEQAEALRREHGDYDWMTLAAAFMQMCHDQGITEPDAVNQRCSQMSLAYGAHRYQNSPCKRKKLARQMGLPEPK